MRPDFYADSRDEWKWSVAIRHANHRRQAVFWAAMLRQHEPDYRPVENALPKVTKFFADERQYLSGQPNTLLRVKRLFCEMGIEFLPLLDRYPKSKNSRGQYVNLMVEALSKRNPQLPYLVLLDPDNGIGEAKSRSEQVHVSHLKTVWNALREGDTLAVVQFKHFIKGGGWVEVLRSKLSRALDLDGTSKVQPHAWDNICLYLVDR